MRLQQFAWRPVPSISRSTRALVAGAELHFPNAVLRFSWQSALAAMRAEIEAMATLADDLQGWLGQEAASASGHSRSQPRLEHIGRVAPDRRRGGHRVPGCPRRRLDELLVFEGGVRGLAVDLGEETIGCVLLGDTAGIRAGSMVHGTGEVARVPVGEAFLGRVVDALGVPLDGDEPLRGRGLARQSSSRRRPSSTGRW